MDLLTADLGPLVFKSTVKGDIGEFSLDSEMLKILMALDGSKSLATIQKSNELNVREFREAVVKLYQHQLIELVDSAIKKIDKSFMDDLMDNLSVATGPIAEVLLEDELHNLGENPIEMPFQQAAELVELLAKQIPRQEKKIVFEEAMIEIIRESL